MSLTFQKPALSAILLLTCFFATRAQDYAWIKGSSSTNQSGVYGTQGFSDASNTPGSRFGGATWTDQDGNLWLFGGNGVGPQSTTSGFLDDLWKYDPYINEWTWVNGDQTINTPGVYGTMGSPDPSNKPGGRQGAATWVDSYGNLWLFGGQGFGSSTAFGQMNDLWVYIIADNQWTWIGGSDVVSAPGVYGTQGQQDPANMPGARAGAVYWTDATGGFWLFGGFGYDSNGGFQVYLNDMWNFDLNTYQWTWVKGSATAANQGIYGTLGVSSPLNNPGPRTDAATWIDGFGTLWFFGGYGIDANGNYGNLSDLWSYSTALNEWTWVNGNKLKDVQGVYGLPGSTGAAFKPGARNAACRWIDGAGKFWLMGGGGLGNSSSVAGYLNDLWRYDPISDMWTFVKGATNVNPNGIYGTPGFSAPTNLPGGRSFCNFWSDASSNLWLFGGYGSGQSGAQGTLNDVWRFNNCLPNNIKIKTNKKVACKGDMLTLSVNSQGTYTWSNGGHGQSTNITPTGTSTYTLNIDDFFGCSFKINYTQSVTACTGLSEESQSAEALSVFPNPGSGTFTLRVSEKNVNGTIEIVNALGQIVLSCPLNDNTEMKLETQLQKGVYLYRLVHAGRIDATGKLLVE